MPRDGLAEPSAAMTTDRVRLGAVLCLGAGLLGFASGAALALAEPAVDEQRFSFPLTAEAFTATQVFLGIHHLGLLAGLLALAWAGLVPASRRARRGHRLAVAGMGGLALTEFVAIAAADADNDSAIAGAVGAIYGLDCLALGLGLVLLGAEFARSEVWAGWRRWVVPALGAWVFVPMFPALVVTPTDGARWAIGAWMLLFAALGVALLDERRSAPPPA